MLSTKFCIWQGYAIFISSCLKVWAESFVFCVHLLKKIQTLSSLVIYIIFNKKTPSSNSTETAPVNNTDKLDHEVTLFIVVHDSRCKRKESPCLSKPLSFSLGRKHVSVRY